MARESRGRLVKGNVMPETLFLVIALVCFIVAALNVAVPRVNMLAAGLACCVVAALLPAFFVR